MPSGKMVRSTGLDLAAVELEVSLRTEEACSVRAGAMMGLFFRKCYRCGMEVWTVGRVKQYGKSRDQGQEWKA